MNILYIHQYFKTPNEPGGTRSYWIARELINNGHQVTMITANPEANKNREEIVIDGIKVIYLKEAYSQSMSIRQRLKSFLGFVIKSTIEAQKHKNIDLVISTSTPLTVGITALYLKLMKKIPYIFEVRDLWPEVPIQMGAFNNSIIIKATRWFEKKIYKNAIHIVTLSPGMQDGVIKYVSKDKTTVIPNMAKIDEFWPREKNEELITKLKLKKESFKVVHFGSLGKANGAHTIIESAKLMKDVHDVEFIFLGGGASEFELKNDVKNNSLDNVKFLGKFAMKDVSEIVNFSDVSIISFLDLPILYTNSPNKLFDSLSAAKPIIVNSSGWTKDIAENYNCGYYVDPNNPNDLVDKIFYLKDNPNLKIQMGINSRKLAETVYDKSILTKKFVEIVENITI